jgi:hypothetical protein
MTHLQANSTRSLHHFFLKVNGLMQFSGQSTAEEGKQLIKYFPDDTFSFTRGNAQERTAWPQQKSSASS